MGYILEMGMVTGPKTREYIETVEECQQRKLFEISHNFKVGDEVYLSATWLAQKNMVGNRSVYADIKGTVSRIKTEAATGPCIQVRFGGVGINIWKPNEDLIRVNTVTEALYGK